MAVFRVNKTENYTVMSNAHLKEKAMSLRAKGLLSLMLSLPDEWDYSAAGLELLSEDGSHSTRCALKELERFGYLIRRPIKNEQKVIVEWEYLIFEESQNGKPVVDSPQVDSPQVDSPQVGNRKQLNTNISKTNKLNKEDNSNICEKEEKKLFKAPSVEEVAAYVATRKVKINAQRFIDYYTSNGWKVGKNPMKDWKAAVRTWEQNKLTREGKQDREKADDDIERIAARIGTHL